MVKMVEMVNILASSSLQNSVYILYFERPSV